MAPPLSGLLRFAWVLVWLLHAVGAALWWWLMPQGFVPPHLKFVANTVIPVVLFLISMSGLGAALRPNVNWIASFAAFPLVFWALLSSAWYYLCPLSIIHAAQYAAPGLLILFLLWFNTRRAQYGMTLLSLLSTLIAAATGVGFAFAQRGPDATTQPYKPQVLMVMMQGGAQPDREPKRPFHLDAENAQVTVQNDGVTLHVLPLLTFISRSPDRCWSIFAPKGTNAAQRQLMGVRETVDQVTARYMGTGESALVLKWDQEKLPLEMEALTGLDHSVYSHMNAYCILSLKGLKHPRIQFSPCADTPINVLPADHPSGHPARFSYIDSTGTFHVAEARFAEKGPFKSLATGPLKSGDPLTLTFMDDETAKLNVTLLDFTAQASTALSPTAGWNIPQNAIEFRTEVTDDGTSVYVRFTLASTVIGRGTDTVGHTAGTYRNRVRVEAPLSVHP